MFNTLIERLPDNYDKNKDSNIGKLYQIYANELSQIKKAFKDIKKYQDIDNAIGKTLDHIGKNVLELRNTDDDDLYRKYIKTKIIANLSQGDIETINTVASFLIPGNFEGLGETWDNPIYKDIAGIIVRVTRGFGDLLRIPNLLNRVKAGGVQLHWLTEYEDGMNLYFGAGMRSLKKLTFKPHQLQDISILQTIYAGTTTRQSKKVILNPAILSDNITLTRNIYPSTVRTQSKQVVMSPILPDSKKEIKENINIIGVNKRVYKMTIK